MGATAALIGLTALQTYSQYQAQKQQSRYQQSMLDANARMADIRAEDAIARGETDAGIVRTRAKKMVGSQRVAMAAQGIDIGSGSAVDVQEDTARMGALDALTVKNNAWREAWGYKAEAASFRSQSRFTAVSRKGMLRNTLLTGGLQAANYSWGNMKAPGGNPNTAQAVPRYSDSREYNA
jgi:hypothetical protein